jgi:outer membrane protein/adhesin transport system outer membrane protein
MIARISLCLALMFGLSMPAWNAARATTLDEALMLAYQNNPRLLSARAQLRAIDEEVNQAVGQGRPTIFLRSDIGQEWSDTDLAPPGWTTPRTAGLDIRQPVYRGGSIEAGKIRAENQVLAQRARLAEVEQAVFGDAVLAYMNVVRDQAELELQINNEQVLVRQLQATRDRFEVGEVTRTDVAQSESRLALATAQRTEAEGALSASLAFYEEVIGVPADNLEDPTPFADLPGSEEDAVVQSDGAPRVVAARFDIAAAEAAIDQERGDLLPRFDIVGRFGAEDGIGINGNSGATVGIYAELSIPLYQGGVEYSEVRQTKQIASQRWQDLETERRRAVQEATRAWRALETADAQIDSFEAQVNATQLALEGVREEATVGARTVLDILDAEQEALDAQVSLVRARRDFIVAGYAVLQSVGRLTADQIGLPLDYYNPDLHYEAVREQIWGTEPAVN